MAKGNGFDGCVMGTSKNSQRHAELVSASPQIQEIAGHARNDGSVAKGVFRSPLVSLRFISYVKL